MSKLVLFPGQGAQYGTMAKDLYEENEKACELLDKIFSEVDFDLKTIMFSEDDIRLNETQYTQPALFAHSLAVLEATDIKGDYLIGHSLGELPALVHAGVLSLEDGIRAVIKRGELMSQADSGAMAAIIGMEQDNLEALCEEISTDTAKVSPANINAPDQIVVSGDKEKVEAFMRVAKERGARRTIPLKVSGAFHSYLMEDAKVAFGEFLNDIEFKDAEIPVIQNVTAKAETDANLIKKNLIEQITSPVRFVECIETAHELGVTESIEVGPKKVQSGLVRKISKEISTRNIDTFEQVEGFINE
ncbi:ACP S-malonyltransferase [Phocicoccus pinnipedialis]|uniref:Malonyl CoA-acyl carrier protein transacylase n=1 Tax=Phocicoccus pinnipedialis TaxID=110845 RepID=A0A6V7RFX4_9BACL|nr:ACP S-malonyltransferase [Jeotgalicoccus pinnipedialis]MBP1939086.1 [acyl-carrier-protein] S-malonyltransferase [Jeotgalicoccus pinnipedialis]CAD2076866.1 Malonyl CoA-acyl carrier protein transacylase [Jeotgalicoccus pinnipedialis]